MPAPTPPQDLLFETTDYDHAGEYLTGAYGTDIQLSGSRDGCFLRHTRMVTDTFAVDTSSHTYDLVLSVEALPTLLIARPRDTTLEYRPRGAEHQVRPGEVYLPSQLEDEFRVRWHEGTMQVVSLPFATLDQVAATAETRRDTPIRFTDPRPVRPQAARHLATTIDYLTTGLRERPQAMREPLITGAAGRMLAAVVLAAFPNTALLEPTIEDRHDAHPRTVRRAIAFIDDHARENIGVAEIAAAAHVTVRALQYAFRRHRGTTPTGYLRQVRLQQVHQELLDADPGSGVTVTETAARWGFFHPGRFAQYYRTAYGHSPYRTLRRDAP
ncbi:AraC family transcriptional regulator [Amycolatopsis anabasis]|uniref:AraC family transcriptional regulator n=1 Tax=Amycolatopsis anabasis TaxID=1840409 RepID=UPI001C551787|nr:helix-turn-helix domain-containing protein [Amycolatopsis anabasis]